MLAEIVIPNAATGATRAPATYTYTAPERLASMLAAGQLVTVPFGERLLPGIVWSLDASEDAAATNGASTRSDHRLRAIGDVLLEEPALSAAQRALAEWISDYYTAPLASAARLMMPPGLLREARSVLKPDERMATGGADGDMSGDEAIVLGLLRERGKLERGQVERSLGRERARLAIEGLRRQGALTLAVELPERFARSRRERRARLTAAPDAIERWREEARSRLDGLPTVRTRRGRLAQPEERRAERLLRQLAALDVLAGEHTEPVAGGWRVEELRRITRITEGALGELVAAGMLAIDSVETRHDPMRGRAPAPFTPHTLSDEQRRALNTILASRASARATEDGDARRHGGVFLLHGITGSGKTEIYLQALAGVIARGERGLVLVPEIALTPQAMERYAGRFPGRVALLHSGLTEAERLHEWRRIRAGEVDVALGSRSALFAPIERLGLIVVDEEHETAYKQERTPTYHARDVATRLGALTGATVVLGSATPSVESYALARRGVYTLIELRSRVSRDLTPQPPLPQGEGEIGATGLPPVTVIDLRAELREGNTSILSERLLAALRETLERGEQAILFLNRRGMARGVVCRECGYMAVCGHCDIAMTYHGAERRLICHYCGRREQAPRTCPICASASIRYFGIGTERVEAAVKRQFPAARVLRWDRDTARTRQAHEDLLRAFSGRAADVLVGTQMIAKGLDLPGVTLVGVVSADVALLLPDFRAPERAFQLLTQVAGRAGRGDQPGQVLVQTFNPEHFCIQAAARHDYAGFFAAEESARERYGYPPFRRFVKLTYEHSSRYTAQIEATVLAERLERVIAEQALADTDIVGPAPAFMERLRGRYRWQVLVRSPDPRPVLRALSAEDLPHGWSLDVDPTSSL
jgi:primosomal protein N' (replication factor Y)